MSKTKTPFFGLGAHGSVGRSITAQGLPKETLVRTKPLPTYRYTLPQAYQRWLYRDYAYLWTQQSEATRRAYAADGVRFHLTGFQYWMKYQLSNLPDLEAWYTLDPPNTVQALDRSPYLNHATIIGATPTDGVIDQGLSFDAFNDYLNCGTPHFITQHLGSFEAFVYNNSGTRCILCFSNPTTSFIYEMRIIFDSLERLALDVYENWAYTHYLRTNPGTLPFGQWHHIAVTSDGATTRIYINGVEQTVNVPLGVDDGFWFGDLNGDADTISLGAIRRSNVTLATLDGYLDNPRVYNRTLNLTEIARHSEQHYP